MHILISQQILLESIFIWGIIQKELTVNVTVPVKAQSKALVYGRSFAGIAGTNPSGAWMSVYCKCCVLSEVRVSSWLLLQWVLQIAVCLNVIVVPRKRGSPVPLEAVAP
jgi:hypothetical protein